MKMFCQFFDVLTLRVHVFHASNVLSVQYPHLQAYMCTVGQLIKGLYVRTSPNFRLLIQAFPFILPSPTQFLSTPPLIPPLSCLFLLYKQFVLSDFFIYQHPLTLFFPSAILFFPEFLSSSLPLPLISIFFCTFFTLHYTGSNGKI